MSNNNSMRYSNMNVNNAGGNSPKPRQSTSMDNFSSVGTYKIIAIVAVMIIIVIVTFWIVNKIRKGSKSDNSLIKDKYIQMDDKGLIPKEISTSNLPSPVIGNSLAYNFWLHLADNYDSTADHKIVFYRGTMTGAILDASPIVAMDKYTNKMHIAFQTNASETGTINQIIDNASKNEKYLYTSIEYIPLQRWVNICIMIQDNNLRVYLDGDIYSVVSTSDMTATSSGIKNNENNLILGEKNPGSQLKGHLANLQYFNYDISQGKIRNIYRKGPIPFTLLNKLGIQNYGVQSPIYKIE